MTQRFQQQIYMKKRTRYLNFFLQLSNLDINILFGWKSINSEFKEQAKVAIGKHITKLIYWSLKPHKRPQNNRYREKRTTFLNFFFLVELWHKISFFLNPKGKPKLPLANTYIVWSLRPDNRPKTTDIERKGPPTSTSFFSWAISTSMFFSAMSLCLCCNSRRLVSVSLSVLNANDNEVNLFWKGKSGINYHINGVRVFLNSQSENKVQVRPFDIFWSLQYLVSLINM